MAQGLFTLRQQVQGIVQKAWNTPVGTYAGSFNGSSQYLSLPSIAAYTLSADFTIEFWVNATSYPSTGGGSPTVLSGTNTLNNWLVLVDSGTIAFYWNQTEIVSGGTTNIVGSWFHVSVVRSGSTVTIYKNGTRLNSATNASSFTLTSPLFIGQQNTGVGYWAGLISNVRIVKGTALYTQNFAPPAAPLAAITNTSLLTLQNTTIIDNSTNAATITNGGSVTTLAAMPFTQLKTPAVDYLVVAGGGGGGYAGGGGGAGGLLQGSVPVIAGSSITVTIGSGGAAAPATDGSTGTSGQNSVLGSITALGGGGGGGYNGSSTTGQAGLSGGSGGGGATISGAYRLNQGGQGTSGQGNSGGIGHLSNGQPYAGGGGGGAGTVGFSGGSSTQYDNIFNGGGAGIASAISGTVTTYAGGGSGSRAGGAYIVYGVGGVGGGGNQGSAGGVNTGGGGAGDRAGGSGIVILSYPDIYAAAASTTGSPTVSTSGSGSLYFAGSSTGLILNNVNTYNNGTTNFTIEFWYYSNNTAGTQFDIIDGTGGNQYFTISMFANSAGAGTGLCYFYNGSAYVGSTAAVNVPTGVWTHFAIVRNGSTVTHYTNGVSQASTTNSSVLGNANYSAIFGKQGNTTSASLVGYLSNFRYVNGTAIYTSAFTPPTTPLTSVTNTSILLSAVSGSPYTDSSTNAYVSTTFTNLPTWNQLSPFATGLGYKNRVYTWTSSGSVTF